MATLPSPVPTAVTELMPAACRSSSDTVPSGSTKYAVPVDLGRPGRTGVGAGEPGRDGRVAEAAQHLAVAGLGAVEGDLAGAVEVGQLEAHQGRRRRRRRRGRCRVRLVGSPPTFARGREPGERAIGAEVDPGDVVAGDGRPELGLGRRDDDLAQRVRRRVAVGADRVLVEQLARDPQDRRVRVGVPDGLLDRVAGVEEARGGTELRGEGGVHDLVEVAGQLGLVAAHPVDLGEPGADAPQRVGPDQGVGVDAAVVVVVADQARGSGGRVEQVVVVGERVAVEQVAHGQGAVDVRAAQAPRAPTSGLQPTSPSPAVVVAGDQVADHVAEVVGEAPR